MERKVIIGKKRRKSRIKEVCFGTTFKGIKRKAIVEEIPRIAVTVSVNDVVSLQTKCQNS